MGRIPRWLLRHQVTIEPYLGDGAHGPRYGPARPLRCMRDDKVRLVRSPQGDQVASSTTLYCAPGTVAPPGSRVTVGERTTTVITHADRDGGGLATPDHVELALE